MRLVSVDVGIRNLAFCVIDVLSTKDEPFSFCIHDWGVFDLCPVSDAPVKCACCSAKASIQMPPSFVDELNNGYCLVHANKKGFFHPKQSKAATLVNIKALFSQLSKTDIATSMSTTKRATVPIIDTWNTLTAFFKVPESEQTSPRDVYNWVKSHTGIIIQRVDASKVKMVDAGVRFAELAKQRKLFESVDLLVIENQIGSMSARMKSMQDIISVVAVFAGVVKTVGVSSAWKLSNATESNRKEHSNAEITDTETKSKTSKSVYATHKSDGISRCRQWIQESSSENQKWLNVFDNSKKKDDLADSFLQAVWMGQQSI